jgi:hypothetical protein
MRYRLTGLCALIVLLATAGQAGAVQSGKVTLQIDDVFVVAGTDLACQTQVGKNVMKGQKLVTCFTVKKGKLPANSFVAALGANGRVVVAPVKANGSIGAPVFDRTPARLGSKAKQVTAHVGDTLSLSGTKIVCVINSDVSGVYPTCFRTAGNTAVPNSYAFAETETFVAVVKFDATGKKTKLVFKRPHRG